MQMIINSKPCDASDKTVVKIINPYNGKVIDTVPDATEKDIDKAVKYAKTAFKTWKDVSIYKKVEIMNKFMDLVDENKKDLAKTLSKLSYICALIVFVSYLFNSLIINKDFINYASHLIYAITLSVTVVVMAVPEGLPMMITLVLSSNMKRLLKRNVLVKRINGIETSGSLNILLTDKTGTLTEGKLKVIRFSDSQLNEYNNFKDIPNDNDLVYQALVYNNNSFYLNNNIEGSNTTDKSILEFTKTDKKDKYKILYSEEFNSKTKYSLVKTNYNNGTTFIKGAY